MRCIVCDKNEWENVDQYRNKKQGMSLCKGCGMVSYPAKWQEKAKVLDFYRKQYRKAPTVENLYQGQRKINYHQAFLAEPVLDVWKKEGKTAPVIFEVGAAYGLVLAWFKHIFPEAQVHGSELTTTYKRNAWHEFQVKLDDDFDDSKQYDLIMSYKVAEHMLDADIELARYRKALKSDGFLYISVPTWFDRMHNFGVGGFNIEYYYAPEHVNVWSRYHFEAILKKTGFKVVKVNRSYYDDTYLCVPAEASTEPTEVKLPKVEQVKDWLRRIKLADEATQRKSFDEAVEYWPNFPAARRALYEYKRADWHKMGVDEAIKVIVEPWIQIDRDSHEAYQLGADLLMRYGRYQDALSYLNQALELRPNDSATLGAMANCHRILAKKSLKAAEQVKHIHEARGIMGVVKDNSMSDFGSAVTQIYADNAALPTPWEVEENVDSKS